MFRKLVIIGIVIGMAGMAMSAKYIGNPTSSNGWSTTSAVTVRIPTTATWNGSSWDWDPTWITEVWTACYAHSLDEQGVVNGLGLDPATGTKHSTADWLGKFEDSNSLYTSSFVMQNKSDGSTTSGGLGYYSDAPKYDSGIMHTGGWLWFAFEFDQSYYVGDILIWNFNEVPSSLTSAVKPEYSSKVIKVSYSEDSGSPYDWWEQRMWTIAQGNRKSWTRGDDGQYAESYPLDGDARVVVIAVTSNYGGTAKRAGFGEIRFEKDPNRATNFYPRPRSLDGSTQEDAFINQFKWTAGKGSNIVKHKVYFSTSLSAVNNRTASSVVVTTTSYRPTFPFYTIFYWAVDELDASNNVVTGGSGRPMKVRPIPVASIEDFESYTNYNGSKPIYNTWKDGWVPSGNYKNGAYVENGQTVYPSYVSRFMKFSYDNDGTWNDEYPTPWGPIDVNYSEVTAKAQDLLGGTDWITDVGGNGSIWLYIMGDASNDVNEPLSMIITDGSGNSASSSFTKHNPTSWLKDGTWHWWYIDVGDFTSAGVDLTDVNTVTLKIGDGGGITGSGNGTLYIDHFRLYRPLCTGDPLLPGSDPYWPGNILGQIDPTEAQGDLNNDCLIDMKDLGILVNNWLAAGSNP